MGRLSFEKGEVRRKEGREGKGEGRSMVFAD